MDASLYYLNQLIDLAKLERNGQSRCSFTDFDISHLIRFKNEFETLKKENIELREENIGVALYETKLLHEKLEPEPNSNVDRHFKHIIKILEGE